MKRLQKKWIAVLSILALCAQCIYGVQLTGHATDTTTYTELTYSDIESEQFQGVTTLDGAAFTAKIKFQDGGYIRIGGADDGNGWLRTLHVMYSTNINEKNGIYFNWYGNTTRENCGTDAIYTDQIKANQEVILRLTFDVSGQDVKVNSYLDNVWQKESVFTGAVAHFGRRFVSNAVTISDYVKDDGEDGETGAYTEITFSDAGIINMENASMIEGKVTGLSSMHKVAFRGNVTYKERKETATDASPWDDRLYVGVDNYWSYDNGVYIYYNHTKNQIAVNGTTYSVDEVGETLLGKEIEYYITFDVNGSSTDIVVFIDNTKIAEFTSPAVAGFGIHAYSKSGTMEIASAEEEAEKPYEEYAKITPADYGYADFEFKAGAPGHGSASTPHSTKALSEGGTLSDLHETYLDAVLTYTDTGASDYLVYASANGWNGIQIYVQNGNLYFKSTAGGSYSYGAQDTGIENGKSFTLKLYTKVNGSDITLCGVIGTEAITYQTEEMTFVNVKNSGNQLGVYTPNGTITMASPKTSEGEGDDGDEEDDETPVVEQFTPEELGYSRVGLLDFGLKSDTYSPNHKDGNHHYGASERSSLDKTYLEAEVTFQDATTIEYDNSIRLASASGWYGVQIGLYNGQLRVADARSREGQLYSTEQLGLQSFAGSFNLKIGLQMGEGTVTYDLWINDVRVAAAVVLNIKADDIGTGLGIYTPSGTIILQTTEEDKEEIKVIAQQTPKQLGYKQVRLIDFAIADGTYGPTHKNGTHHFEPCELESLNGTYLDVNMSFQDGENIAIDNSLRYVSTDGWKGIQIGVRKGVFRIYDAATGEGFTYAKEELGLSTFSETFNLKFGVKHGRVKEDGTCDITFDFWINDVRIAAEEVLAGVQGVGNGLGIYTPSGTIILSSPAGVSGGNNEKKAALPKDFRKVTFHSFGIQNKTYKYNDSKLGAYGDYALSLDRTIFSADVYFSHTKGGDFRYGGKSNEWCGLWFHNLSDGKLYMRGVEGETGTYVFNSVVAGVELTDNWYNIKISTEYVDSDKDGKKDDVKVGVWFNDILYDNEYLYLNDYVQHMGNYASVYVDKGEGFIKIKSDKSVGKGIDFTLFGFTENWEKEVEN